MPQISEREFERLPLRAHQFLAGVPLHDVWAFDLPSPRAGITLDEFLRVANERLYTLTPVVRGLLDLRLLPDASSGGTAHDRRPRLRRRSPTGSPMPIGRDRWRQLAFARGRMGCCASSIGSRTKNWSN